jgi:hypothetical protein
VKRLFSSHDRLAVHHARNVLEAEGVRAVVKNDLLSSAMGELPPAECQAELWVLSDADAERAHAILARLQPAGPEWRCARCAEACEAQFTQCWRCGAYRPT